ncbi:DUF3710 domain-containing protein [Litorihabitans aurantiacus]|uniref:DUF3710 domain-containing protein n=1 Tax=Litorihabitans aurantiacus TaxID=1930061 RepID=A0AA38CSA6_9MICO|nr:DUF3710 domain-containing protein [Litorihabitans aurantiacus]GMA31449.1 hypothetical protein GCM10025875_14410 [Litorihabitans aurantiacus]
MAWFGRRRRDEVEQAQEAGADPAETTEVGPTGAAVESEVEQPGGAAATAEATEGSDDAVAAPPALDPDRGPWDVADAEERLGQVDLGALRIPGRQGMALRMELDRATRRVIAANITIGQSNLQVQAFSAPRTAGIWDDIRAQITDSIGKQGGQVTETTGPFGRELLALLPVKDAQGNVGRRPARFLGVDGPRWFLRGVLTGAAVADKAAARDMEQYFSEIVVVRGTEARPPSELLALTMPGRPDAAPQPPAAPNLLERGPEISEVR